MRAVVQRVSEARVTVGAETVGEIAHGLCILVGVTHADGPDQAAKLARKVYGLRIFDDADGVMNLSVAESNGAILVVSQFTLYGDVANGRRPSYTEAARPEHAEPLVSLVVDELEGLGASVATGRFRADMVVSLVNQGPCTILVEV